MFRILLPEPCPAHAWLSPTPGDLIGWLMGPSTAKEQLQHWWAQGSSSLSVGMCHNFIARASGSQGCVPAVPLLPIQTPRAPSGTWGARHRALPAGAWHLAAVRKNWS